MVESLVITLREGIEAALVVGIVLAYLSKAGRAHLRPFVFWGLGLGVAAAVAVAGLFMALGLDPENEYLEGALLGIAGLMVASLVVWMGRAARNLRAQMERRLEELTQSQGSGGSAWGLLAFTFFMVFREGMETVLFLAAATLGEGAGLAQLVGGVLGLGLAVLFGVFLVRGSLRLNLSRFFAVTSLVLFALAAKLLAGSVHEFAEVGVLPMSREIMAVLGYFVRDASSTVILMALLAAPLLVILWDAARQVPALVPAGEEGAAARRLRQAAQRRERLSQGTLLGVSLIIFGAMVSFVLAGQSLVDPTPQAVSAENQEVSVPLDSLQEGQLHKFSYAASGGPTVRFLVASLEEEGVVAAFDACTICGAVGYAQEGENAICKNCNAPIPMSTLGLGGGCNPIALKASVKESRLVVPLAELLKEAPRFK